MTSPYVPNTDADRDAMLQAIGADTVHELFRDIPSEFRNPDLALPSPLSELDLGREIARMASQYAQEYWNICESMISVNEEAAFAESTGRIMSQGDMKRSIIEEKLRFQRSELNDRVRMRLRMTLNEDQVKEVPGLRLTVTAAAEK